MARGHLPVQNGADVASVCENITSRVVGEDAEKKEDFKRKERRKMEDYVEGIVCIHFGGEPDARVPNLNYTLHTFEREQMPKELEAIKFGKPAGFEVPSGVDDIFEISYSAQIRIDHAHLELQKPGAVADISMFRRRFPTPDFPSDSTRYRTAIYILVYCFIFLLIRRIIIMTHEHDSGLKELQCLMGLPEATYWLAHYCACLVFALADSAVILAFMFAYKHKDFGVVYLENADPTLVLVSFLVFCFELPLLVHLVTCVTKRGNYAVLLGLMVYTALPLVQLGGFLGIPIGVGQYIFRERATKLLSSIYPHFALCWVLRITGMENDYSGKAGWNIIAKKALGLDNVTILEIWAVTAVSSVVLVFVIWYLSRVLPWVASIPQHPLFPFMRSYWAPTVQQSESVTLTEAVENRLFEPAPKNAKVVIVTRELRKTRISRTDVSNVQHFGQQKALDGVDIEIYEKQVTLLLGHNGAGKTTLMSILTGILNPSGGVAMVCGYDVVKSTASARRSIGLCQQYSVFFPDLTVREHLVYFGKLKGLPGPQASTQADEALEAVGLQDKPHALTSGLSGGMQRRLSIAIATASNPQVVILDEPSAGLDAESKREIWDLLLGMRSESTLIISTHDMEEADVLADRIIVMADGRVLCSGSPAFLKKAYGVGYQLRIIKDPKGLDLSQVLKTVRKTAPKAEADDRMKEAIVSLNTLSHGGFVRMFEELEERGTKLGIKAIGVMVATLRDVYIKINLEWVPDGLNPKVDYMPDEKDVAIAGSVSGPRPGAARQLGALLTKRVIFFFQSYFLILLIFLAPALVFLSQFSGNRESLFEVPVNTRSFPLSMKALYGDAHTFGQHDVAAKDYFDQYRPLVESEYARLRIFENATKELLTEAQEDYVAFSQAYLLGGVFEGKRLESWYNPFAPLSQAIGVNLLDTALLRLKTGNHAARIRTTLQVTANPLAGKTERQKRLADTVASILKMVVGLFPWIFAAPVVVGLLLSGLVIFPFTESVSHAKELQLMTGVSGYLYCLSNFLFDLVVYLAAFVPLTVCFVFLYSLETQSYVAVAAVVLAHSMVGVLWPHLIAAYTATQAGAFALILLPFAIGGPIQALIKLLLGSQLRGMVNWIVLFLPPGSLAIAILKVIKLDAENKECLSAMTVGNSSTPEGCRIGIWQVIGYGLERCCEEAQTQTKHVSLLGPFSPSHGGILFDLLAMSMMGVCLFALISWKDSGRFWPSASLVAKDDDDAVLDSDVQAEKQLVDDLCSAKKFHEHSLVAHDVHKWYKSLHAVRGLNFAVAPSECFGLLGVNGAGKTSTFQVLTALLPMSQGDGYMEDVRLSSDPRKWQSHIGYCLQYGGLLDKLNSYQLLYLFARLRGVPEDKVKPLVDSMISVCDLQNHAHKKYGSYSGGNKRKLCMAVAYIGLPRVVFLDEPTAGVDVVARSKIFSALKAIRSASGNSLVLTSHSMDECELVCDRIGIMVAGQFQCLGTLQHLKGKFGKGYTLNLQLKSVSTTNVADFRAKVEKTFPGIKLKDHHEDVFDFHMEEKLPWSVLFAKVEELELLYPFDHVLVSECTLEQIFIGFAREQDEKGLERDNTTGTQSTRTTS